MSVRRWWRNLWRTRRSAVPLDQAGPACRYIHGLGAYGAAGAVYRWAEQPTVALCDVGRAGNLTPAQEYRARGAAHRYRANGGGAWSR